MPFSLDNGIVPPTNMKHWCELGNNGLMLKHTKKLPIELKFLGPSTNKTKAIKALKSLGFVNISDTVPWRDLFPEYADEELPGICLAGSRHKENMTQVFL